VAAALCAGEGGGRLPGTDGRALGHVMTVQRRDATRWITDRAFERSPFAQGVSDPELRFLWINASSAWVITHSQEQVLGKKYREVLPEFDRTLFPEGDDKPYTDAPADMGRTGEPTRLITVFRPRGSDYTNAWATSIWSVRDSGGRVRAIAGYRTAPSLETLCDTVIDAMLPTAEPTNAALLFARMHAGSPPSPTGMSSPTTRRCRAPGSSPSTSLRSDQGRPEAFSEYRSASLDSSSF
jgi:hypothetical protein